MSEKKELILSHDQRALLSLIKTLHRLGIIMDADINRMASDYMALSMHMALGREPDVKELLAILTEGKRRDLSAIGLDEIDEMWFMTLNVMAGPKKTLDLMGFKNVDELKAAVAKYDQGIGRRHE